MTRRLLVDEAKRTAVVALPQTIEQRFGEGQPKTIIRVFLKFNAVQLPCTVTDLKCQLLLNDQIAVINEVTRSHPIDAEQLVTRLESQLLTDRASLHGGNHCWIGLAGSPTRVKSRDGNPCGGFIPHSITATVLSLSLRPTTRPEEAHRTAVDKSRKSRCCGAGDISEASRWQAMTPPLQKEFPPSAEAHRPS